jgi:hypothetical protein
VHRDIFDDACAYFSPYAVPELAETLAQLLAEGAAERVQALRSRGAEVSARFLPERVMPMWRDFLSRVKRSG